MADHYRALMATETIDLSNRVNKYNSILELQAQTIPEAVVGQIHLVIGMTNLFLKERFKQFAGLIEDCELERGEKKTTVEDLAGFWDMIYYQVEDLKHKYERLAKLEQNGWQELEDVEVIEVVDNSAPKKTVTNGNTNHNNKAKQPLKKVVPTRTQPHASNFRQFLKNKRKDGAFGAGGEESIKTIVSNHTELANGKEN